VVSAICWTPTPSFVCCAAAALCRSTQHRVKLPDAIIAATVIEREAVLITDDQQLRKLSAVKSSGTGLTG
jgi:predicted nucleic acid-binding protein